MELTNTEIPEDSGEQYIAEKMYFSVDMTVYR